MYSSSIIASVLLFSASVFAFPSSSEVMAIAKRAKTVVHPDAVTSTTCTDTSVNIVSHDANVALLAICGGIAGTIQKCGGNPASTTGASGTAKFTLTPVNSDATLIVSKGRWEHCVTAARATCPKGTFESTCIGGTTDGDFKFVLSAN